MVAGLKDRVELDIVGQRDCVSEKYKKKTQVCCARLLGFVL